MNYKIPFIDPVFPSDEEMLEDYRRINKNNYYTNNGEYYFEFKDAIEKYIGYDINASIVSNATAGLLIALKILADPKKKYVIVPSFTFAAGPLAIKWADFEPFFIDVDLATVQPELNQAKQIINEHPDEIAAILFCNSFGIGCTLIDEWETLAKENSIPLIIDSAAGFGSEYTNGEKLGSRGDCEIFSLHATKPFAIGEGGIISSKNEKFIEEVEMYKNFGFNANRSVIHLGMNAKIPEISCAIGLRLIRTLETRIQIRQDIFAKYRKVCEDISVVSFISNAEKSSLCFASLIFSSEDIKIKILDAYIEAGIEARDYYNPPVHKHDLFYGSERLTLNNTESLSKLMVSLPNSDKLIDFEIDRIMKVVTDNVR